MDRYCQYTERILPFFPQPAMLLQRALRTCGTYAREFQPHHMHMEKPYVSVKRSFYPLLMAVIGLVSYAVQAQEAPRCDAQWSAVAMAPRYPSDADAALLALARQRGTVKIIVQLKASDGSDLSRAATSAATESARLHAIACLQQDVLRGLGMTASFNAEQRLQHPSALPEGIHSLRIYRTVPMLALTLDADSLALLLQHPAVAGVQHDMPQPPIPPVEDADKVRVPVQPETTVESPSAAAVSSGGTGAGGLDLLLVGLALYWRGRKSG